MKIAKRSPQSGQSITEYITIGTMVAMTVLGAVQLVGSDVRNLYVMANRELTGGDGELGALELVDPLEEDPFLVEPEPEPPPPPPADPLPVGIDDVRHHLGDGNYGASQGGGSLENEGISYTRGFNVNMNDIQASGYEYATLTIMADGVTSNANYRSPVKINGQEVGTMKDGVNTFRVPVSSLQGSNSLQIDSGSAFYSSGRGRVGRDYDDFEVWDISMTWD